MDRFPSLRSFVNKVEKILKGSMDSIPSPSPSVKIQIMGGKVYLRCKGKTLLGIVKNFLFSKVFWQHPAMFYLHASSKISLPIIWIFTEGEGDGIESMLLFKIFSTLMSKQSGRFFQIFVASSEYLNFTSGKTRTILTFPTVGVKNPVGGATGWTTFARLIAHCSRV